MLYLKIEESVHISCKWCLIICSAIVIPPYYLTPGKLDITMSQPHSNWLANQHHISIRL